MATLQRQELEQIVEEQLPGFVLAKEPTGDSWLPTEVEPEAVTPPTESVREKVARLYRSYTGEEAPPMKGATNPEDVEDRPNTTSSTSRKTAADETDDIVVLVKPKGVHDPWVNGPGPKAVVISGTDKRVIGVQG